MLRGAAAAALVAAAAAAVAAAAGCAHLSGCSGHGACDTARSRCDCESGWGAAADVAAYKAPDCSLRTCPADRAWVDVPSAPLVAHATRAECSNMGLCDRATGKCRCFAGFEGEACQRSACPGTPVCSGHGRCLAIKQLAPEANAVPFGGAYAYGGEPDSATWDEDKIYGCVCDSEWQVRAERLPPRERRGRAGRGGGGRGAGGGVGVTAARRHSQAPPGRPTPTHPPPAGRLWSRSDTSRSVLRRRLQPPALPLSRRRAHGGRSGDGLRVGRRGGCTLLACLVGGEGGGKARG